MIARVLAIVTLLFMAACGGGGGGGGGGSGGGNTPPPGATTPPSGLSYSAPQAYLVGQEITPLQPTITGVVSSYSIAPPLPGGLNINATTGVIAGTPTNAHASTSHTITASNDGGSTTATVTVTVTGAAPDVSYEDEQLTLTTGVPVQATPTNRGGAVATWSIAPPLPAGLSFSATDGSITGIPTEIVAPTAHVVTAENSLGTETLELTVAVDSGVLIDIGHGNTVTKMLRDGSRLLSVDYGGRWVLWNVQNGENLASGNIPCEENCATPAALIGPTLALRTSTGLELRSSSDGALLASLTVSPYWWKLAADGRYVVGSDASGLTVWSPAGDVLISRTGNYANARVYAAADEIRVARGPGSANQIEIILMPTGSPVAGPTFLGEFHSWFLDGERFLTNAGNTVRIYSRDGTQEDIKALTSTNGLAGQGQWFWTHASGNLRVYAVNGSATPTIFSASKVMPSGTTIGVLPLASPTFTVLDISGPTLTQISHSTQVNYISAYAATSTAEWHAGSTTGLVFDLSGAGNTPSYFAPGSVRAIVGSANRVVVSTASGDLLYFNATTRVAEGRIAFPAARLAISNDGTVLVAGLDQDLDHTVKIFSLPSGTELETRSYTGSTPFPIEVTLSGSGTVLGEIFSHSPALRTVTSLADNSVIWTDTISPGPVNSGLDTPVRISPNGTLIAAADLRSPNSTTNIFVDGTLTGAAAGWGIGWIDNDRLLVNRYQYIAVLEPTYAAASIVNTTGAEIASPKLPHIRAFQTVSPDSIYSPAHNAIYSLTTGSAIWKSESRAPRWAPRTGAAAGGRVIFAGDGVVRTEPY